MTLSRTRGGDGNHGIKSLLSWVAKVAKPKQRSQCASLPESGVAGPLQFSRRNIIMFYMYN